MFPNLEPQTEVLRKKFFEDIFENLNITNITSLEK